MSSPASSPTIYDRLMVQLANAEESREQELARIRRIVATYERIHGMLTAEMLRLVEAGEIEETDDICRWSLYTSLLDDVA